MHVSMDLQKKVYFSDLQNDLRKHFGLQEICMMDFAPKVNILPQK